MSNIIFDGPVPSDQLTWYVKELPRPTQNVLLERIFPYQREDKPYITLDAEITSRRRTAAFRTPDGHFREIARDVATVRQIAFMMLGVKSNQSEYELMQQLYADMQGGNMAILKNALYKDAERLVESVYNRLELAAGDLMDDGILSVNEEGVIKDLDFGVPADHFMTADILWDSGTAHSKLEQLLAVKTKYRQVNNVNPAGFICDEDTYSMLLRDEEFKPYFAGAFGTPNIVTESQAQGIMTDLGVPKMLWSYENTVDVLDEATGTDIETKILQPGVLYFLPPEQKLGSTRWGVSTTERELINAPKTDFGYADAAGVAVVEVKNQAPPFAKTVYADAVATPVLESPKKLMTLKVREP